ncbi:DUF6226 family protein [Agromyces silvae]|uniref:DUF6226 family protein n=1 Tax=Agromyces silvae TaxID=3388266 RepID=UPI00280B4A1B|nr:DUF6226 family protein [Agromyces protaetiae]
MTIELARRRGEASGIDALEWAPRWTDSPDADAYSRVTDPERFRVLQPFVLAVLADLEAEFNVRREPAGTFSGGAAEHVRWSDPVRLVPADAKAAPLTVAFTSFPGVLVRFGEATDVVLPFCGCDACDDLVQHLVEDLRFHVEALVTGGFAEWHDAKGAGHRFAVGAWGTNSSFTPSDDPPTISPFRHDWAPWPLRVTASR